MNILDARKYGKRLRPIAGYPNFHIWEDWSPHVIKDNLLEEWEIEEKKIEITKSQAIHIFNLGCVGHGASFDAYVKELGFDE